MKRKGDKAYIPNPGCGAKKNFTEQLRVSTMKLEDAKGLAMNRRKYLNAWPMNFAQNEVGSQQFEKSTSIEFILA